MPLEALVNFLFELGDLIYLLGHLGQFDVIGADLVLDVAGLVSLLEQLLVDTLDRLRDQSGHLCHFDVLVLVVVELGGADLGFYLDVLDEGVELRARLELVPGGLCLLLHFYFIPI